LPLQAIPYVTILGFFFGSTLVASRFSVGQFHPLTYIGLRMVLASIAYIGIYTLGPQRFKWPTDRRLWKHAAILGVIGTAIPMSSIVTSLQYQSSGVTAVLLTCGPAITVMMAHFTLADESLSWLKSAGVMLALSGALLLALRGETGLPNVTQSSPIGYILVLFAMLCASSMTIYARKFMREFDSFEVGSVRMFVAALVILPTSLLLAGFELQNVTQQGYFALIYAALVGTFGAFLLAFYNIKHFGATTAAMVLYVTPIVAGFAGVLILDETITSGTLAGAALIVVGIAIINRGSAIRHTV